MAIRRSHQDEHVHVRLRCAIHRALAVLWFGNPTASMGAKWPLLGVTLMPELMKGEVWADAQKLVRGKPRFQYPIVIEVKADEIRCHVLLDRDIYGTAVGVQYLSYAGKPLHNLGMFTDAFLKFFQHTGYRELDIGIEVNGNFNDSYRWTQSSSGIPQEKLDKKTGKVSPALFPEMVKILLFDLPEVAEEFRHRLVYIDNAACNLRFYDLNATRPVRRICWNYAEVMSTYAEYRALGHEGAMGKTLDHLYERKRSFNWMKIKPKEFLDGVITGINRAHSLEGVPLDRAGSVAVRFEDGSTADCGGLKHAFAAAIYADPSSVIGEWCECERMEADRAGGSRHPIFKRLREAKA